MSIVGNGPMFRDAEDFRQDARIEREREDYRLWCQSPRGRQFLAQKRAQEERYHRAAKLMSRRYAATQTWIEAALRGANASLPEDPDFGTPEAAILRDGPAYNEASRWFSH